MIQKLSMSSTYGLNTKHLERREVTLFHYARSQIWRVWKWFRSELFAQWNIYIIYIYFIYLSFPGGSDGKESACNAGDLAWSNPWIGKIPWRKAWQSTLVFLPGESMDRGACWATVCRVGKNQTQLKRLSTTKYNADTSSPGPTGQ